MQNKVILYFLEILLIIVRASSDSASNADVPSENDENLREGREINEESYDGPIDLNEQLQKLNYVNTEENANNDPPHNSWRDLVPGTPGFDYPSLTRIPETSFSCDGKNPGGYYADVETGCQVFHICNIGGFKSSFLCPEGSIFNQRYFVCDWWYGFRCDEAISLYPEYQSTDSNQPESNNSPTSEAIDNYEPILLHNDNPTKDLTSASTGDGRLQIDNQRQLLNYKQRNLGNHDQKHEPKLSKDDYVNNAGKFHHHTSSQNVNKQLYNRNLKPKIEDDVEKSYDENKTTIENEYIANTKEQNVFRDTSPRGFALSRQKLRRNTFSRDGQISRQGRLDAYSNFNEKIEDMKGTSELKDTVRNTKIEEEIRYVPAL